MSRQSSKLNRSSVEVAMGVGKVSLGGCIKALGDGVQTGGRSEGDSGGNDTVGSVGEGIATKVVGVGLGISGPLAVVAEVSVSVSKVAVGVRSVSLGGGIKALGDGVQTSGRTEGNASVGDAVGVWESVAVPVEGISLGLDGHNKGSSEERLEHVAASLLTQTENHN